MFSVGDRVEVRDKPEDTWQSGVVESIQANGRPRVKRDMAGGAAFPWNEVRISFYSSCPRYLPEHR